MKKSPKTPAAKSKSAAAEFPYAPKTAAEKSEAFRLADLLLSELAKEEALRELLADSIPRPRKR